jgi:hypothetical protein
MRPEERNDLLEEENAKLRGRVAELEKEIARYKRRYETVLTGVNPDIRAMQNSWPRQGDKS